MDRSEQFLQSASGHALSTQSTLTEESALLDVNSNSQPNTAMMIEDEYDNCDDHEDAYDYEDEDESEDESEDERVAVFLTDMTSKLLRAWDAMETGKAARHAEMMRFERERHANLMQVVRETHANLMQVNRENLQAARENLQAARETLQVQKEIGEGMVRAMNKIADGAAQDTGEAVSSFVGSFDNPGHAHMPLGLLRTKS